MRRDPYPGEGFLRLRCILTTNSTRKVRKKSLTARIVELENERDSIKKKLEAIERVVRQIVNHEGDDDLMQFLKETLDLDQKPKRGRRPRVPDDILKRSRDQLLILLKVIEPRFKDSVRESSNSEELILALKKSCPERLGDLGLRHLMEHGGVLWEFIHTDRYAGNIENIAYAMAGVPLLKPRASLDRCGKLGTPDLYDDRFA